MLRLVAAHMRERQSASKPLIWVDIGGGTGGSVYPYHFHSIKQYIFRLEY